MSDNINVSYSLTQDWGDGFEGKITIANNSDSNLDSWDLDFDLDSQITGVWDAQIVENNNGSYTLKHQPWNREIKAGESLTFNFVADGNDTRAEIFNIEGSTFSSPSSQDSIYSYSNPNLDSELSLGKTYQGRATFYDAANPTGGKGNSGYDVPVGEDLAGVVAINNIQWNGSEASGGFLKVSEILTSQKYVVDVAKDGQMGWDFVQTFDYDLILLDVMLPKLDGFSLCHRLRENGYKMPVMMLTAVDSVAEKVKGLDAGADDYMVKPFKLEEFLARIRALLRRKTTSISPVLKWGDLRLNSNTGSVSYKDKTLSLTPKEYRLLELFMRNGDKLLSRSAILENLWNFDEPPTEDAIKAHVKRLRGKLSNKGAANCIQTVYGLGYRLV